MARPWSQRYARHLAAQHRQRASTQRVSTVYGGDVAIMLGRKPYLGRLGIEQNLRCVEAMTEALDAKAVEIGGADVGGRHDGAPHIAVANHHFVAHDTEWIVSIDHQ